MTMQQASEEELLKQQASKWGQAWEDKVISIKEEDYKNLQSFSTRANQERIDLAIKLANKDKKSILEITDKKLQNKVVKEIYNLDNIEEVKLIHWANFYEEREDADEDELSELDKMKRELSLLKYSQSKSEIEWAIEKYKEENKDLFKDEEQEIKFRDELKYISSDLPTKERISRASKIVFGINATDAAYIALQRQVTSLGNPQEDWRVAKTKIEDEIKQIFKRK